MDEPNYQLTDANGNVIGEIGATSDGAVVVEHSSGEQAVLDGDGLEVPAVSTKIADITDMTFIKAQRDSDSATTSAGDYINVFDNRSADNRDELNQSGQFSPDNSGEYDIILNVALNNGASGDEIVVRFRNTTDGTDKDAIVVVGDRMPAYANLTFTFELDSSKTYEVQATDLDSSFVVSNLSSGRFQRNIFG